LASAGDLWAEVLSTARHQVERLRTSGRWLSRNDLRIIVMAQLVRRLSQSCTSAEALVDLERENDATETAIDNFNGR